MTTPHEAAKAMREAAAQVVEQLGESFVYGGRTMATRLVAADHAAKFIRALPLPEDTPAASPTDDELEEAAYQAFMKGFIDSTGAVSAGVSSVISTIRPLIAATSLATKGASDGELIAGMNAELTTLRALLVKAGEELRPIAGCIYNDNGDLTVDMRPITYDERVAIYFAYRALDEIHRVRQRRERR